MDKDGVGTSSKCLIHADRRTDVKGACPFVLRIPRGKRTRGSLRGERRCAEAVAAGHSPGALLLFHTKEQTSSRGVVLDADC